MKRIALVRNKHARLLRQRVPEDIAALSIFSAALDQADAAVSFSPGRWRASLAGKQGTRT